MNNRFYCKNEGRRKAVGSPKDAAGNPLIPELNGIDYLEVAAASQQKTLDVYFLHPLPGETGQVPSSSPPLALLTKENVIIKGGVRIKNVRVESVSATKNVLSVTVNEAGDFSMYKLRIITSPTSLEPPSGFDPQLSFLEFSFKVGCPSEFDCKADIKCPPEKLSGPEINYLAKDYASFRRLILDRLSVIMPDWRERNPADLQIALIELLAYAGDHLSYYQDAVATEAYLGTARKRTSVRRHARLVDYFMHDGCNSRTWVCLEVEKGGSAENQTLTAHTVLLTGRSDNGPMIALSELKKALNEQPVVFETMHDLKLRSAHNRISFYTWNNSECCLPRGSTHAWLLNKPALSLKAGDVLILEEVLSPTTGMKADADPDNRHAVRLEKVLPDVDPLNNTPVMEIEWNAEDALHFPLCISAVTDKKYGQKYIEDVSIATGNIVLADNGFTIEQEPLVPASAPDRGNYRPRLQRKDISFAMQYKDETERKKAASVILYQDPREALPLVTLKDNNEKWNVRRDLLGSDRFAAEFVVETEQVGKAQIRFGDNVLGKQPSTGTDFTADYRIGNGLAGNVGAEAIGLIVPDIGGISGVRNPMSAVGGANAETMEEVRQFAPQAFRIQERAVTEADYAEVTERHPEVQKAAAMFRWTGSWHTVFVTVDRKGGREVDADFEADVRSRLERFRIAGYDLEVDAPRFVALEIVMTICVKPGYFQINVKETLMKVFSRYDLDNGQRGFFHPDNFTFNQPVYLSQLYERAMDVAGVASVDIDTFKRWGKKPNKEIENGVLTTAALEIVRLDNDRNFQENGKIEFIMKGGL